MRPAETVAVGQAPPAPVSGAERHARYRASMARYLAGLAGVHLLTRMPGNTGDQLIDAGTRAVLADSGQPVTEIPVDEFPVLPPTDGTLVIPGSGAFDRDWHEWLPQLVIEAADRFAAVVIMPSSFDTSIPIVRDALLAGNVYPFAREARSYASLRATGRAGLSLDPAMYAPVPQREPGSSRSGVLLALREDRSSLLAETGFRPHPERNCDISAWVGDFDDWWQRVLGAERVITDRLHVAVAALRSGTPLTFAEPRGHKISTYLSFTFAGEVQATVGPVSPGWLQDEGWVIRA